MLRNSILIDADAFLAIRSLSVLREIQATQALIGVLVMCQVAARRELCTIDVEVRDLEARGYLNVYGVERRTPADVLYRQLKQDGVDKGEAEAIAWAATLASGDRPIFISIDRNARRAAEKHSIRVGDVMDLVVLLVEDGALNKEAARTKLLPWTDPVQQQGRPRDLTPFDFETAFERRRCKHI